MTHHRDYSYSVAYEENGESYPNIKLVAMILKLKYDSVLKSIERKFSKVDENDSEEILNRTIQVNGKNLYIKRYDNAKILASKS